MKLGFADAILNGWTFEEVMVTAARLGYECMEAACWSQGKAERRYADASHIDVDNNSRGYVMYIHRTYKRTGVEISALAYHPSTMGGDFQRRKDVIRHLRKVIAFSEKLDIGVVAAFAGGDQTESVGENSKASGRIWPLITQYAEEHGIRIAIEDCLMLFGREQWPEGHNLFMSPALQRKIFDIIPNKNLGINYDPSHFVWQVMDYIQPIYELREKILYIYYEDIKAYPQKLKDVGIMTYPSEYMGPELPGLGGVDWGRYVSALTDIGYDGSICMEVEDRAFKPDRERILDNLKLSERYTEQFVI